MVSTSTTPRVSKYNGKISKCHIYIYIYKQITILLQRASKNLKLAIIFKNYYFICYYIKLYYKKFIF